MLTIAVVGQKGSAIADVVGSFQPAERLFAAVLPAADPACLRTLADLRAGFAASGSARGSIAAVRRLGVGPEFLLA